MHTAFTGRLGIDHPLVGFNRSPGVVAAVTNAGGLGVLAATAYDPTELDAQLTWIEAQVGGRPYGVDLLVPEKIATGDPDALVESLRAQIPQAHREFVRGLLDKYRIPPLPEGTETSDGMAASVDPSGVAKLLDVAFKHPIALIASALGAPPPHLVDRAHERDVVVASLVGHPRHAERQLSAGVDVLVAQGTEAGGHTGTIATTVLTPEIVALADDVPVLAAGGIASGTQMAAALALGASGVWCGSVWLSSVEDVTPPEVKGKFLAASSGDTLRSRTRTGKPARQLRSAYHDEWDAEGSPNPLPMPLQPMLVHDAWARIDAAAAAGNAEARRLESFFIGQVVGAFDAIRPAGEIARRIVADCEERLRQLSGIVAEPGDA